MRKLLTVPSPKLRATLDERRFGDPSPVRRTNAQRDRDRVLYSSALLRLGQVTQVAAPEAGYIFHSRLTHSLKVAQVARRLAERFQRALAEGELAGPVRELVLALDPDAAETAALAHDLGHPPYGHLAEDELASLAEDFGGFEGNAQSFRIVTRLARRKVDQPGLNLTRRTLNGLLKYPTPKVGDGKWGVYDLDLDYFEWVRDGFPPGERTLEAEIMDWADDVTYAVHDMEDFYRAGLIPLDRLRQSGDELMGFEAYLRQKEPGQAGALINAAERLLVHILPFESAYRGQAVDRAALRRIGSLLITRYMDAVRLADEDGQRVAFEIADPVREEVTVLKQLTWFYIIERPSLATIQAGQRRVIGELFKLYDDAARATPPELRLFPPAFAERIDGAAVPAKVRAVVDLIAGMTEASAEAVFRRQGGVSPGSLLANASGLS